MDQQPKDDSIDDDQIEIKEMDLLIMKDKEYQIDLPLIMKTSIDQNFIDIMTEEQKTNELMHLKTIHLEFLNIKKIENLELFDKLQVLFLQHNKITQMENLDTLINLEYLCLKNNQIQVLQGLKNSRKLAFLDVSENQISQIIFEQVPQFIEILNISNNPIETNTNIRKKLISHLKIIDEIDSVKVDQNERFQALGIFPSELEQYQKKLTQRKMKKIAKFKKLDEVLDVDTVEIKGDDIFKDDDNLTETTIQGIHDLTETLITKAQTSKLERLYEAQQELLEINIKIINYMKQQTLDQEILQNPEEQFLIQYKLKNVEKSGAYKFSALDIANLFEKNFEGAIFYENFQLLKVEINEQIDATITTVYEEKEKQYNKFQHIKFLQEILNVEELKPDEEEEQEEDFSQNVAVSGSFIIDEKLKKMKEILDVFLSFQDAIDQVESLELINKFFKALDVQQQKDSKVQIKLLVSCKGKYALDLHQQKLFFYTQDKDPAFIDLMSSKPYKNKELEQQLQSQIFKVKKFSFGMLQCNQKKEFKFQQFYTSTKLDNYNFSKQYVLKDDPKHQKFISLMIMIQNSLIIKVVIDLTQVSVIYSAGNEYYCKLLSPPQFYADLPGKQRFEKNNIKSQFKQVDNIFLNYLFKNEKITEIQRLMLLNNQTIYFELEEKCDFLKYKFENFGVMKKTPDKISHVDLQKDLTFNRLLNSKYLTFSLKFNILSIVSQNKLNIHDCIMALIKTCENEAKQLNESSPQNLNGIFELAFSQFCKTISNLSLSPDFEVERRNILYHQQFIKILQRAKSDYIEINDPKRRLAFIRRISLTPSGLLYFNKQPEMTSGILRQHYPHIEQFIRVHFENENQDNISNIPYITQSFYQDLIFPNLNILNKKYELFTWSGSSLRAATCWFVNFEQTKQTRMQIIQSIGNFTNLKQDEIAKNAARLGQNLSSSFTIELKGPIDIRISDDLFDENKKLYTDGIGKISEELILELRTKYQFRNHDSISAIQIRYEGAKGLLVLDETLKGKSIILRKSMIKYNPAKGGYPSKIQVLDFNKYRAGYLNRQIIILLLTLKVNEEVFMQLQNEYLKRIESLVMKDSSIYKYFTIEYCDELLGAPNVIEAIQTYINIGMENNILCLGVLQKLKQRGLLQLRKKTAILVEKAARVLGVVDEHRILEPNEVYCLIYDEILKKQKDQSDDKEYQNVVGQVLVTRNPCLHPGDIKKLTAVSTQEILKRTNGKNPFSQFVNCLVFPAKGNSLPCQIAGGDLDGDLYFISWDDRLLPPQLAKPMIYDDVKQNQILKMNFRENNSDLHNKIDRTFEVKSMIDFLFKFLNSETLGKIDNSHLSWADSSKLLANDPNCLELAELHSEAVDFVKNGKQVYVDPKLICKIFPDYMEKEPGSTFESQTVIGKMYRQVLALGDKYDSIYFGYLQTDLPQIELTLLFKFRDLVKECQTIQPDIKIKCNQQIKLEQKNQDKQDQGQKQDQQEELQLNEEIIPVIAQYIEDNFSKVMKFSLQLITMIFEQFCGITQVFNVRNEFEIYSGNFSNLLKGDGLHHKKKLNVEKNQKRIIALVVQLQQELEKKLTQLQDENLILRTISFINFILSYSPNSHNQPETTLIGQFIKQIIEQLTKIENWKVLTQSFTVWYRGAAQYFFWKELKQIHNHSEEFYI